MKFAFCPSLEKREIEDALIFPFWEGPKEAADRGKLKLEVRDFSGKMGETLLYYDGEERILLLGLGEKEQASVEVLRRAYSCAMKMAQEKKLKKLNLVFPQCKQKEEFLRGIVEGVFLSNYSFTYKHSSLKDNPIAQCEKAVLIGIEKGDSIKRLIEIGEGVNFVRDLINENADNKIEYLIEQAKKLHPKVKTTILDKKRLESEKMGLLLAVSRGSNLDPCLIQASYRGKPSSKEHIVLVGKGLTYDTGGLSLKPTDNMLTMKCDMSGAAAALGTVKTAARLGLKVNVTAIAPVTENSIGSKSYKLGDVYRSYSGTTVEINNTDAEGRLVLADALAYAVENLKPSCLIDLATLTGACVVALGEDIAGLFTDDEDLAEKLLKASEASGDLLCRLPIYADYKEAYKSEIADLTNSGGREAGAIKGALFLKEFVKNVPWAHMDIAGPAYLNKPKYYHPTKATGYGLRLLITFLENRS